MVWKLYIRKVKNNFSVNFAKFWVLGKYTDPRIHGPHTRTVYFLLFLKIRKIHGPCFLLIFPQFWDAKNTQYTSRYTLSNLWYFENIFTNFQVFISQNIHQYGTFSAFCKRRFVINWWFHQSFIDMIIWPIFSIKGPL